jgi:prepilin-type processing-associated H-X9-DG protein
MWFAGCGQSAYELPPGDEQRGSADVVLGVRELNSQQNHHPELDQNCPAGPYHFQPDRLILDAAGVPQTQCDVFHFWSRHYGGANFVFADGSVRFLSYEADKVMEALGTREGREVFQMP